MFDSIHPRIIAIVSVLTGTIAGAFICNFILGIIPWQPPQGVTIETLSAYNEWVKSLPDNAYLSILGALLAGALSGGAITHLISRKTKYRLALFTGFLLIIFAVGRFLNFTHPEWLTYAACCGMMGAAWLGGWLVKR